MISFIPGIPEGLLVYDPWLPNAGVNPAHSWKIREIIVHIGDDKIGTAAFRTISA